MASVMPTAESGMQRSSRSINLGHGYCVMTTAVSITQCPFRVMATAEFSMPCPSRVSILGHGYCRVHCCRTHHAEPILGHDHCRVQHTEPITQCPFWVMTTAGSVCSIHHAVSILGHGYCRVQHAEPITQCPAALQKACEIPVNAD